MLLKMGSPCRCECISVFPASCNCVLIASCWTVQAWVRFTCAEGNEALSVIFSACGCVTHLRSIGDIAVISIKICQPIQSPAGNLERGPDRIVFSHTHTHTYARSHTHIDTHMCVCVCVCVRLCRPVGGVSRLQG